eukprot:UN4827
MGLPCRIQALPAPTNLAARSIHSRCMKGAHNLSAVQSLVQAGQHGMVGEVTGLADGHAVRGSSSRGFSSAICRRSHRRTRRAALARSSASLPRPWWNAGSCHMATPLGASRRNVIPRRSPSISSGSRQQRACFGEHAGTEALHPSRFRTAQSCSW